MAQGSALFRMLLWKRLAGIHEAILKCFCYFQNYLKNLVEYCSECYIWSFHNKFWRWSLCLHLYSNFKHGVFFHLYTNFTILCQYRVGKPYWLLELPERKLSFLKTEFLKDICTWFIIMQVLKDTILKDLLPPLCLPWMRSVFQRQHRGIYRWIDTYRTSCVPAPEWHSIMFGGTL